MMPVISVQYNELTGDPLDFQMAANSGFSATMKKSGGLCRKIQHKTGYIWITR